MPRDFREDHPFSMQSDALLEKYGDDYDHVRKASYGTIQEYAENFEIVDKKSGIRWFRTRRHKGVPQLDIYFIIIDKIVVEGLEIVEAEQCFDNDKEEDE